MAGLSSNVWFSFGPKPPDFFLVGPKMWKS